MSSSISEATGKQKKRSVKKLERCQGFDIPNGLSLAPRAVREREGPIGDLYESLKSLNEMRDISPQELRVEARQLFDILGSRLWPRDTSRAWWLLKPSHSDYPRHLYYDNREDQEQLWLHFSEMVQEKRLNHEDHMSRQNAKSGRQSEETEAGFADEVRYEYAPTANMRNGSAISSRQSPVVQSDVPTDHMQVRTRVSASSARPPKRPATELLERMSLPGLPDRNKRPANDSPETMSMSRLHDRDKRPVIASSSRAGWESFTSPLTTSAALESHVNGPHPSATTSRLQAGQEDVSNPSSTISDSEPHAGTPDAQSATPGPQASTSYHPSATPGLQTGAPNPLAKVRIFLEVKRSTGPPKKCWSIPVEEMDIFTGERVRTRLQKFKLLKDSEKVLLVHIRPDDGGRSVQGVGVETTFIMPWDSPEQPDWEAMLEGLQAFYSKYPTALDLKLRATLDVEAEEVYM